MSLNSYTHNGEKFFQLKISCPICFGEGRATPSSFWVHEADGGEIYVSDKANYRCNNNNCGMMKHVMYWQYGCPEHASDDGEYVYKKATVQEVAGVVAVAGMLVTETGLPWLKAFLKNLENEL